MPSEPPDERSWNGIEGADKDTVEQGGLPPGVKPRPHGKPFRYDTHLPKAGQ